MKEKNLRCFINLMIFLGCHHLVLGQDFPSLSPYGKISQVVGNTTLEIEYERPSARSRTIFGALVPWGRVWRTGAGHCTKISFDRSIVIGEQVVPAGKYSVFSIPNPEEWIIILNADTTLYGTGNYDPKLDVARITVTPDKSHRFYETLTIDIDLIPNNANIYLSWANTQVHFKLQTTTDEEMQAYITEQLLTEKETSSDSYAGAAEYLHFQNTDTLKAIKLTLLAIKLDPSNGWAIRLNMELYEKSGRYENALATAEAAAKFYVDDPNEVQYWKAQAKRLRLRINETLKQE